MPDVERFRVLLEQERERRSALLPALRADIAAANSARQDSNVDDEHDPEGATIAFERSQIGALAAQAREHLAEVDRAMARLDDATYGTCERCGRPIPDERLEARPTARRCVTCAVLP